jgi:hypothetical protein
MPLTSFAWARANGAIGAQWTTASIPNAASPNGSTSPDDAVVATGTTTLNVVQVGRTDWNDFHLLAEEAGPIASGAKLPQELADELHVLVLGVRVEWEYSTSGGTPTATFVVKVGGTDEPSFAGGAQASPTKVTQGWGTLSAGSTSAQGNGFGPADLSTVAGQRAARALLANGQLLVGMSGSNSNALANSTFNLDYVKVTVEYLLVRARAGALSGAGALAGARRADRRGAGALAGAGALSGARRAIRSGSGSLAGVGRLSSPRGAAAGRSGALLGALSAPETPRDVAAGRAGALSGAAALSGSRAARVTMPGALVAVARLSGGRRADRSGAGTLVAAALLASPRGAAVGRAGALLAGALLAGARGALASKSGALLADAHLEGVGRLYAFGLSGVTRNAAGTVLVPNALVVILRTDVEPLAEVKRTTSDGAGAWAVALTSDPFTYLALGRRVVGDDEFVDVTGWEETVEETLIVGPPEP